MMNKIIEEVFQTNIYTLTKMDKGITNKNFLLTVNNQKYVVRMPYEDSDEMFHRSHEKEVLELVQDLDVPTVYFDEATGIKITVYISDLYEFKDCPYPDKIARCATLMKALHQKEAVEFEFQPIETLLQYKKAVSKPLYNLAPYTYIIDQVKGLHHKKVLCHNDIVSGNILYGKNRDYLIDYEYAASNDALFDVMSFISENQITDPIQREQFYKVYFDSITDTIRQELTLWEAFHNLLWCYWAMMLYESRQEVIYQEIALSKFEALKKMKIKSYD